VSDEFDLCRFTAEYGGGEAGRNAEFTEIVPSLYYPEVALLQTVDQFACKITRVRRDQDSDRIAVVMAA